MPCVDFWWPRIPITEAMFEEDGLEPYLSDLVQEISVKLKRCIRHRMLSCFSRACVCLSEGADSGGLLEQ